MIATGLASRGAALAAVALLAGVLAFAANSWSGRQQAADATPTVEPVPAPGGGWYQALAAPYPRDTARQRTACGHELGPETLGVAHAVLPCGVKLFISYGDRTVLTQVVDRGPAVPGRAFDLTPALADRLGIEDTQQIRWRYAR